MSVLTSVPVRTAGTAHCSILQLVPLGLQSFHCATLAVLITWSLSPQLSFIHPYSFPYLFFFTHMDFSVIAQSCGLDVIVYYVFYHREQKLRLLMHFSLVCDSLLFATHSELRQNNQTRKLKGHWDQNNLWHWHRGVYQNSCLRGIYS